MASNENLPPKVIKELVRELRSLEESPPEDIRVIVSEDNFANIHADIDGPSGTPYDGGIFRLKLILTQGFPQMPPKGYFVTRIFHPNISKNGEICVNTLKKDWKPTLGLRHVLLAIRCLLIEPFPESALNEEAGKMLMEDYDGYARHARLLTNIHAMKTKSKAKAGMAESTAVNAGPAEPNIDVPTPLTQNNMNVDACLDGAMGPSGAETTAACLSPSAKKPKGEHESARMFVEKRKVDGRKKSLKRL